MATPEEIKADQDAKAAAAKAAQDAKAAEAKAAQDAKDAEAKAAKEAKEKADLAELHTWVARSMLAAHQTDHPSDFDKIDPTPAMTAAREFVAAFKAMGSHKPKPAGADAAPFGWGALGRGDTPGQAAGATGPAADGTNRREPFGGRVDPFGHRDTPLPGPITGLSGTVNGNNTVTLKWDAPAPAIRPGTANSDVNVFAPASKVAVFEGDIFLGDVPMGTSTYTTGMMTPGPHVFTVAVRDAAGRDGPRSNAYSVTITAPVAPVAPPQLAPAQQ